jgi:hypothetical protein
LSLYEYDAEGRRTREVYDFENDGTIDSITLYTYDDRGRLVLEEELYSPDSDSERTRATTYRYDDYDNLVEEADYRYDGRDNLVEKRYPSSVIEYTYRCP